MAYVRVAFLIALAAILSIVTAAPKPVHAQDSLTTSVRRSRRSSAASAVSSLGRRRRRRSGFGGDDDELEETPTPIEEAVSEAIDEAQDRASCFPPEATVELRDGSRVRMDKLAVGDIVRVAAGEGDDAFSPVFMFTHRDPSMSARRVTLETSSGASLSSTSGHYVYADGALVRARDVKVGAKLTLANGQEDAVTKIVVSEGNGVYNPQTVSGDIMVDGVLASTYTTALEPRLAHILLAPFRALNKFGFQLTALESGAGSFEKVLPSGRASLA